MRNQYNDQSIGYLYFYRGHFEWNLNGDYDEANIYSVFCITSNPIKDLLIFKVTMDMIALIDICYDTKEY